MDDGTLKRMDAARTAIAVDCALYGTVTRGVIEGRREHITRDVAFTFDLLMEGLKV